MKIIHSGDWHIGTFKGPVKDGVNLRTLDTKHCLESMVERAGQERPELVLVSGDIFETGRTSSDRCCAEVVQAIDIVTRLAEVSVQVVVMRGTPNHDGIGPFNVLEKHFARSRNIHIVVTPSVIQTENADIAVLPGFDRGEYRAKFPNVGAGEENEVFSRELGNIVMGLRAQCRPDKLSILMAHYTVPGCDTNSGQSKILTQIEPIVSAEALQAANYDLVALGHIHKPQVVAGFDNVFYSGSINANNFNDEGQERGFWIHYAEQGAFGQPGMVLTDSEFVVTPYREFLTLHWTDADITAVNSGSIDEVAMNSWRWNGAVGGKIVRVLYQCTEDNKKALNTALVEKTLYEDGAFWVAGVNPEGTGQLQNRENMSLDTDPEENLKKYLEEKGRQRGDIERLISKARPIIAKALDSETGAAFSGIFVPLEIEVKNYRAYVEEKFSFEDIQFCTINGQNGAGKSSLFMDAIIDCIYEKPREGSITDGKRPVWLRNDERAKDGHIILKFAIGDKIYRITRSRKRSGEGKLNLAELVDGEWKNRSQEKANDTQKAIEQLIGIDSMTFKSCALIMQDQYGLFLQARKEDRMSILSNLLNLGIYDKMEDFSKSLLSLKKKILSSKKNAIEMQSISILEYGKPNVELESAREELQGVEQQIKVEDLDQQNANLVLANAKAAAERYQALMDDIAVLDGKKQDAKDASLTQNAVIQSCDAVLAEELTITENAEKYRALIEKEKTLIEGTALYEAKLAELQSTNEQISGAEKELAEYEETLSVYESNLKTLEDQEDREQIKAKAAEYQEKKQSLDSMYVVSQQAAELADKRSKRLYAVESKEAAFGEKERTLLAEKISLQKRTELLDDSGCVDIENAACRFLADAVQAKAELETYPEKFSALKEEKESALEKLRKEVEEVDSEIKLLDFSAEKLAALQKECAELEGYGDKLRELERQDAEIALIKARIDDIQVNISKTNERLSMLKLRAQEIGSEAETHKESYLNHSEVLKQMEEMKAWPEKEKELPVIRERRANAEKRISELTEEINSLELETVGKHELAEKEKEAAAGYGIAVKRVEEIQSVLNELNQKAKDIQTKIGGLEQKVSEVEKLRESIKAIQAEIKDIAEDVADYEALKISFGQSGIPHQIVRTILPKLSNVTNNILGQMTNGQLGVKFVTEKAIKNTKKGEAREVVTLDIIIEEHGQAALPYLSKSGGEKVKSSLAVILALAEIKASTAGIQFGFLLIDEPPFLDQDGVSAYCDALEAIRERYPNIKVMAITHDIAMKERFPQSVDIVKTDNGSKVVY